MLWPPVSAEIADAYMLERDALVEVLTDFLSNPARPPYTMNFHQLDGYVRALAAGPGRSEGREWIPLVFGDEFPNFESPEQESAITNVLICLYTWHSEQVKRGHCNLPFATQYSPAKETRLDAEQWARGFMQGFIVQQDIWDQFFTKIQTSPEVADILRDRIQDEIDAILEHVSTVADPEYAVHKGIPPAELNDYYGRLPEKMNEYGRLSELVRNSELRIVEVLQGS